MLQNLRYLDVKPLFHSDRGYQYTSKVFKAKLDATGVTQNKTGWFFAVGLSCFVAISGINGNGHLAASISMIYFSFDNMLEKN